MPDAVERLKLSDRERGTLSRKARLSLAVHVAILLLCMVAMPDPFVTPDPTPEGKGAPASVAMVMEAGAAEGVEMPIPSHAPATVAAGETPSMAPLPPMPPSDPTEAIATSKATEVPQPTDASQARSPPPTPTSEPSTATLPAPPAPPMLTEDGTLSPSPSTPAPPKPDQSPALPSPAAARAAPKPVPHIMTTNRLPVPVSHTMKQPKRTANSQGASDPSPGPQAVNSAGAPPHETKGQDATTSVDGAAGEDGKPSVRSARSGILTSICTGTIDPMPITPHWDHWDPGEWIYAGRKVPIRAHFFRTPDGTPWVHWYIFQRPPIDRPVMFAGGAISWVGQYPECGHSTVFSVSPAGGSRFAGAVSYFTCDPQEHATMQFTCVGSDAHPF